MNEPDLKLNGWTGNKEGNKVICKDCNLIVTLNSDVLDLRNHTYYICPRCSNIVAVLFNNSKLQPSEVMNLDWNTNITRCSIKLADDLYFAVCNSKKDDLVLRTMQTIAKDEDTGFFYAQKKYHKTSLIFNIKTKKYMGFLMWSEEDRCILRQLYIMRCERRKGYASKLLKFWVNEFANKLNTKFKVDNPNGKMINLLLKLGYAKKESNSIIGVNCSFLTC